MAKKDYAKLEEIGLKETFEALDDISPRLTRHVLDASVRKGANILVRRMRQLAPVLTGKLKRSIGQKKLRVRRDVLTRLVGPRWPEGAAVNFLEYGAGARRVGDKNTSRPNWGITPRRFVARTYLSRGGAAFRAIREEAIRLSKDTLDKLGQEKIPPALKKRAGF